MQRENKNIDAFDAAKFAMSIMVVGVHTLGKYGIYPLFRIAVPMFFIISSYLFFENLADEGGLRRLKKFCMRSIKLYLFWFIALAPIFLYFGEYFAGNIGLNIIKLGARIVFGSSFASSWYISALVIGICIIFFLKKARVNDGIILVLTFFIYAVCCFNSNYRNCFSEESIVTYINKVYPGTIYNGFPVGLFWIALGCRLSTVKRNYSRTEKWIGATLSYALLLAEHFIVNYYGLTVDNDCYFMLIPVCYFLFLILADCKQKIKGAKTMRKLSTVIYCVHGSLATLVSYYGIFGNDLWGNVAEFFVVIGVSMLMAILIFVLEKSRMFSWLRLAY